MINHNWSWSSSHKGIMSNAKLALLVIYRELKWHEHRKDVIEGRLKTAQDFAGLFKELIWYYEEESLQHTDNFKKAVKYEKYMNKHKEDL